MSLVESEKDMIKIETTDFGVSLAGGFPNVPEFREKAKEEVAGVIYAAITLYSHSYKLDYDVAKLDMMTELAMYEHKIKEHGEIQGEEPEAFYGTMDDFKKEIDEMQKRSIEKHEGKKDKLKDATRAAIKAAFAKSLAERMNEVAADADNTTLSDFLKMLLEEDEDDQTED